MDNTPQIGDLPPQTCYCVIWPNTSTAKQDPVAKHFADAFQSLQGVDLATSKADAKGSCLGMEESTILQPSTGFDSKPQDGLRFGKV